MFNLTELNYSEDRTGTLKLYIYEPNGFHRGGVYFERRPRYPDEEITTKEAKQRCDVAMEERREIRITNGNDWLVFHAKDGRVIHPHDGAESFWRSL